MRTIGAILLGLAVTTSVVAEVIPFDSSAVTKVFQEKSPALFLFSGDDAESEAAKKEFEILGASAQQDFIVTISDKNDGHGLFDRLAQYLGVDSTKTPQVLYLNKQTEKFFFENKISADDLKQFVQDANEGKYEKYMKSAPIPEDNTGAVKIVVGKNFKEVVLNSDKQVLVKFYAPWCGHCKTLAPEFQAAAEKLSVNPNVLLVKVDSTQNEVPGVDIQGFPTLYFYTKDKTEKPIEYNGQRNAAGIISWIKDHTTYDWVEVDINESEL